MRSFHLICLLGFAVLLAAEPALAAKTGQVSTFRMWWDQIWRIINFLILAFLLVKVAKEPVKNFLAGQREKVASDFQRMEQAKEQAVAERQELEGKINNLAEELARYEDDLAQAAAEEREVMLADARREADMIMERAQLWSGQALRKARQRLAGEILELAAELATEKMRAAITAEDQRQLIAKFSTDLSQAKTL